MAYFSWKMFSATLFFPILKISIKFSNIVVFKKNASFGKILSTISVTEKIYF